MASKSDSLIPKLPEERQGDAAVDDDKTPFDIIPPVDPFTSSNDDESKSKEEMLLKLLQEAPGGV